LAEEVRNRPISWQVDSAHPYGVLPGGNNDSQRHAKAGRGPDDLLSDERWDDILILQW
jgi:hypothetical protein